MRVRLMPRLNAAAVDRIHGSGNRSTSQEDMLAVIEANASVISFAASGGERGFDLVKDVAQQVRLIARSCGFPDSTKAADRTKFDVEVTKYFASRTDLDTGESLRNDTWAMLTSTLLMDVVAWRFPGRTGDDSNDRSEKLSRYQGGVRNTLQRLWIRSRALDRGQDQPERWALIEGLGEDAMVQIFERPSLAADARLARALAEGWVVSSTKMDRGEMEDVMRTAMKIIRIRNEIIDLGTLSEAALKDEVDRAFSLAAARPRERRVTSLSTDA